MRKVEHDAIVYSSDQEQSDRQQLLRLFRETPLPDDELLDNLGLFLTSKTLARILFFYEIYKKIVETHGIILDFGTRWGQTTSLLAALRGIFEPFNRHRKIVGFDTFEGHIGMSPADGYKSSCRDGSYSVSRNYEEYLSSILAIQEKLNPLSHITKFEVVKGDATITVPEYLERHPETLVSLAVFDFDIYAPTKAAMEAIKPRLFKGSVLVFDELCDDIFPGETSALMEVLGANNVALRRYPMTSRTSYMVLK